MKSIARFSIYFQSGVILTLRTINKKKL